MTKPLGASPRCDGPCAGVGGDAAPCSPPCEAAGASGALVDAPVIDDRAAVDAEEVAGAEDAGVGEAGGGDVAMVEGIFYVKNSRIRRSVARAQLVPR